MDCMNLQALGDSSDSEYSHSSSIYSDKENNANSAECLEAEPTVTQEDTTVKVNPTYFKNFT